MTALTEHEYRVDAAACGCEYLGMQERPNKSAVPLFQDHKTGTSFTMHGTETVREALLRVRKDWKAQQ